MEHIYPSITAPEMQSIKRDIKTLEPYCQGFHIDVMDGQFVPTTSWGADTVNAIAQLTYRMLWVHLMIENPIDFFKTLSLKEHSIVTLHIETIGSNLNIINDIKEKNLVPSLAISPKTPVEEIFPFLNVVHHITVMSVEPGFAGQQFLRSAIDKIERLDGYRQTSGLPITIALDGGVNEDNITELTERGVDLFGVASAIFGKPDPVAALKNLQKLAQ